MREVRERAREIAGFAVDAERRGDLANAVAMLEEAIATDPKQASWCHRLGLLRSRREDWLGAVAAFELATELDPGRASRYLRLGSARERSWDLAGACDAYTTAAAMAPTREAWYRRLQVARTSLATFSPFNGQVIAHRGSCYEREENARESLARLPAEVSGVEVDVRLSRDGVAVLMHDARVDRTTDGHGLVEELSYADLSGLRGVDGVGVPTLASYLHGCQGRDLELILIDVKTPASDTFRAVASTVRASAVAAKCVVMVRGKAQMRDFREVADDMRMGGLGAHLGNVDEQVAASRAYGAELLLVAHGDRRYLRNRGVVPTIRGAGLRSGASIINSWDALDAVRADGCDVLLTDRSNQLAYFTGQGQAVRGIVSSRTSADSPPTLDQ